MLEENKYEAVLNFKEEPRLKRKHVIKNVYIYFPQVKFINCCYCQVCGREAKHLVEIPLTFRDTRVFLCCSFHSKWYSTALGTVLPGAFQQ